MVPLVAPNGAVLGVTLLDEGQQGIKKPSLDHGFSREGVLLSETGQIFTVTKRCSRPATPAAVMGSGLHS